MLTKSASYMLSKSASHQLLLFHFWVLKIYFLKRTLFLADFVAFRPQAQQISCMLRRKSHQILTHLFHFLHHKIFAITKQKMVKI